MKQSNAVVEKIFEVFHPSFVLQGILSQPEVLKQSAPLVIIPNSGLVHRVGTCRTSVRMSRALAQCGCLVLRLDLSNLGESPPRMDRIKMTDDARTVQELKATVDQLYEHYGERPVIMYGLCSGSQNGFKLAVKDDRVVGLFGVDHFSFRNWSFRLVHYARQFFRKEPWVNRMKQFFSVPDVVAELDYEYDFGDGEFQWHYPSQKEIEDGYRILVNRNIKMQYIYTGDWSGEFNHRQQFFWMHSSVDFKNTTDVHYMPHMSHILSEPSSQEFVEKQLIQFVAQCTSC